MSAGQVAFTVFSKHWTGPLAEVGRRLAAMGFEGVELPVRPGFQVEPANVAKALPEAARILGDCGLRIGSVAGPTDEPTIAACAAVGVPLIRICCAIPDEQGYLAGQAELQKQFDGIVPLLEAHGVAVGVQNHCGRGVFTAMDLRSLVAKYDPKCVCAVLDFGHAGLTGQPGDVAVDMVWSHLRLVNFKNAYWRRDQGRWRACWVGGREGMADWAAAVAELKKRGYSGDVCLTAEYDAGAARDRLVAEDLAYVKSLFG